MLRSPRAWKYWTKQIINDKIDNPVAPSGKFYGGWATDISKQFPNHKNLHIFHIAGGQEVIPASGVRTFSAYNGDTPPEVGENIDWGWYRQIWVPWAHTEIGNPYSKPDEKDIPQVVADTIDANLQWMENILSPTDIKPAE